MCASLAHIAVATYHRHLTGNHHVGSALDAVGQRLAAAVEVVKLTLRHRVVHVEGREQQLALLLHLVEAVHTCGGLLTHAAYFPCHGGPQARLLGQHLLQYSFQLCFILTARRGVEHCRILLGIHAEVYHQGSVATVVNNHVGALAVAEVQRLQRAPPIVSQRLALPCKHGYAEVSNGSSGMILCGVDVA